MTLCFHTGEEPGIGNTNREYVQSDSPVAALGAQSDIYDVFHFLVNVFFCSAQQSKVAVCQRLSMAFLLFWAFGCRNTSDNTHLFIYLLT